MEETFRLLVVTIVTIIIDVNSHTLLEVHPILVDGVFLTIVIQTLLDTLIIIETHIMAMVDLLLVVLTLVDLVMVDLMVVDLMVVVALLMVDVDLLIMVDMEDPLMVAILLLLLMVAMDHQDPDHQVEVTVVDHQVEMVEVAMEETDPLVVVILYPVQSQGFPLIPETLWFL